MPHGQADAFQSLQDLVRAPIDSAASRDVQVSFEQFRRRFSEPVTRWAQTHLARHHETVETVFYPFGGPDFLFPFHLFPQARDYLLVGAEPCHLAPLSGKLDSFASAGLADILRHYLDYSYFITKDLQAHLALSAVVDVLPVLLAQIAHAGLPLHRIDPVGESGAGACILFGDPLSPTRLYYFRQDLRDHLWTDESPLSRCLDAMPRFATFVKSGSYLLHEAPFERLRCLVRERTDVLIQDPSGIPYGLLREWGWHIELHGSFVADIPAFMKYDQSELAAAYRDKGGRALSFGVGYLYEAAAASLIVAAPVDPSPESSCGS